MAIASSSKRRASRRSSSGSSHSTRPSSTTNASNHHLTDPESIPSTAMKTSPAANSAVQSPVMNAHTATISDKRRMAALIGWQKRKAKLQKTSSAAATAPSSKPKSNTARSDDALQTTISATEQPSTPSSSASASSSNSAAVSVTPPKRKSSSSGKKKKTKAKKNVLRRKMIESADALPMVTKKRKVDRAGSAMTNDESSLPVDAVHHYGGENAIVKTATVSETVTTTAAATDADSHAPETASSSNNDESTNGKSRYTAEKRRIAAKAGWEKRKLAKLQSQQASPYSTSASTKVVLTKKTAKKLKVKKEPRENSAGNSSSAGTAPEATSLEHHSEADASSNDQQQQQQQQRRNGGSASRSTRTSRRNSQETDEARDEIVRIATYLKISRGWMEFHPSSRYGNGTATYAFVPASIALFVRNGTIPSQHLVLKHGELGVHYALDYNGFGGLRTMIDKFGEDYAPYPTDDMLASSKELQEKRNLRVTEWDLGDDLPWREVDEDIMMQVMEEHKKKKKKEEEQADEVKQDDERQEMIGTSPSHPSSVATETEELARQSLNESVDESNMVENMMFFANILASLDSSTDESIANQDTSEAKHEACEATSNSECNVSEVKSKPITAETEDVNVSNKGCKAVVNFPSGLSLLSHAVDDKPCIVKDGSDIIDAVVSGASSRPPSGSITSEDKVTSHIIIEKCMDAKSEVIVTTHDINNDRKQNVIKDDPVNSSVIFIQTPRRMDFKQWHFGLV